MSQLLQVATRTGLLPAVVGTLAPLYFDQGIPYDAGGIAVDTSSAVDHWHQGLPFTATGRIRASVSNPDSFGSGAAPFAGQYLSVQLAATDHTTVGIPFTAASAIART